MNGLGHLPNPLLLKWMNLQRLGSRGPNRVKVQPMCGHASFWHCCLDSEEPVPMLAKRLAPAGVPPTRHSCVRQHRNWQLCWVLTEWWTSPRNWDASIRPPNPANVPTPRSRKTRRLWEGKHPEQPPPEPLQPGLSVPDILLCNLQLLPCHRFSLPCRSRNAVVVDG